MTDSSYVRHRFSCAMAERGQIAPMTLAAPSLSSIVGRAVLRALVVAIVFTAALVAIVAGVRP